jgi:hypothetical protein
MAENGKKAKPKSIPNPDFEAVRLWYKMEFANYSFELVRDIVANILKSKLSDRSLEYYAMTAGLICIYARPFTNNKPVGELSDEIVPPEFKSLHDKIITMRHKLFAHADASLMVGEEDYPNEAVIENDGKKIAMAVSRVAVVPSFLEQTSPLVQELIKKTNYYRTKHGKKFANTIRKLGKGDFRLNVVDPSAPLFVKLSTAQSRVRQEKRKILDPNSTV